MKEWMIFGVMVGRMVENFDLSPLFNKKQQENQKKRMDEAYEKKERESNSETVKYKNQLEKVLEELKKVQ